MHEKKQEELEEDHIRWGGVGGWASMNLDALLTDTTTGAEKASEKLEDTTEAEMGVKTIGRSLFYFKKQKIDISKYDKSI